jgi:hypothetical protein
MQLVAQVTSLTDLTRVGGEREKSGRTGPVRA